MEDTDKQEPIRDEKGKFVPGVSGNPAGRPKGKTIKERVQEYLDQHPDDMEAFVAHFVKDNRELAWQMLEGRPSQGIGQAEDLEKLQIVSLNFDAYDPDRDSSQPEG